MIKLIKKIFDFIFILIIVLLVGYFCLRNMGVIEIYRVETGSMEQGIHAGDYVLICEKEHYVIGDIVTYRKDNYFITHRIIKSIDGNKVITKGDANNTEDEEIDISAIEGKVIFNGGILNFVIDFKYAVISMFLGLYLLSCYYGKDEKKKDENVEDNVDNNEIIEDNKKNDELIEEEIIEDRVVVRKRLKKKIRSQYRKK